MTTYPSDVLEVISVASGDFSDAPTHIANSISNDHVEGFNVVLPVLSKAAQAKIRIRPLAKVFKGVVSDHINTIKRNCYLSNNHFHYYDDCCAMFVNTSDTFKKLVLNLEVDLSREVGKNDFSPFISMSTLGFDCDSTYIAQAIDILYRIAKKYGVKIKLYRYER